MSNEMEFSISPTTSDQTIIISSCDMQARRSVICHPVYFIGSRTDGNLEIIYAEIVNTDSPSDSNVRGPRTPQILGKFDGEAQVYNLMSTEPSFHHYLDHPQLTSNVWEQSRRR